MTKKVALIVGSLRKDSWNRKIALELKRLAQPALQLQIVEIGELPLYNSDLEEGDMLPESWITFRSQMAEMDAVIFLTPEYNRSIPGALKNAIDVGSRPYGHSVWDKKSGAVISITPGGYGAFGANHVLRQSMVFLNVAMMQQPEMYLSHVNTMFGEDGLLTEKAVSTLTTFLKAFEEWTNRF